MDRPAGGLTLTGLDLRWRDGMGFEASRIVPGLYGRIPCRPCCGGEVWVWWRWCFQPAFPGDWDRRAREAPGFLIRRDF